MKSYLLQSSADRAALELRDVPVPQPGPQQLRVRMRAASLNRGEFIVPPPYAESMYDRGIQARGVASKITVIDAK